MEFLSSEPPNLGNSLFKEIVHHDTYRLRGLIGRHITKIIDIGANYGVFSLYAKTLFPGAQVYAFEPNPQLTKPLFHNLRHINAKCFQAALHDGPISMASRQDNIRSSITCFGTSGGEIPGLLLPELLAGAQVELDAQTLIKIDCEGGEQVIYRDTRCIELLGRAMHVCAELHEAVGLYGDISLDKWFEWVDRFRVQHPSRTTEAGERPCVINGYKLGMLYSTAP